MQKSERTFEFSSVFAPYLSDYILLKKSMGKKIVVPGTVLRLFDRYCKEKNVSSLGINSELVDGWLTCAGDSKASTRSTKISQLKGFADYLSVKGYEVTWIPKPGYGKNSSRYLPYIFSEKEILQLLTAADELRPNYGKTRFHSMFPVILRVLYCTGMRVSEVLKLKGSDVNLTEGILYVYDGKFEKSRRIPVSQSLLQILNAYYTSNADYIGRFEDNYFFPNALGEQYSQRTVYDKFREVLWKANIPHQGKGKGPRVHDLRHTFAVHSLHKCLTEGKDPYAALTALMVYLGHSRIGSTEYYLRLTEDIYPEIIQMTSEYSNRIIPKEETINE